MTAKDPAVRYHEQWQSYWQDASTIESDSEHPSSIWDMPPEKAVQRDLPLFSDQLNPSLPLVDFGCGSGIQTRALAGHFPKVIGTDVAPAAVDFARTNHAHPNASYEVLNAFDLAAIADFHKRYGDVNVYMRFVIHHVPLEERPLFARNMSTLLGKSGSLFLYELDAAALQYCEHWIAKHGVPNSLARAMQTGAAPGPVDGSLIRQVFPEDGYDYLREGQSVAETFVDARHTSTPNNAPGGGSLIPWAPPTYYALLRPRV